MNKMKYVREKKDTVFCAFCCEEIPNCRIAIRAHSTDHNAMFRDCSGEISVKFNLYKYNQMSEFVSVDEFFVWN